MSIEMAEHMDFSDHAAMQEVANAVRDNTTGNEDHSNTTTQKRKRGLADQDESADTTGRSNFKRMSRNSSANAGHGNQASNPSGNSIMNNQQDSDAGVGALPDFTSGNQNGGNDHANASSTAAAALAGIYPTMTIPQPTDVSFATQASEADRNDQSFNMDDSQANESFMDNSVGGAQSSGGRGAASGSKPAVGSEEWHKVRKDNHKEVERRRRETINEGINELSKIVPGCEKNKGSILQRAVQFITQLKENEAQNIEKWTLEKLLTEQAIAELSASNDKLKAECERAWREVETWKKTCQSAGLAPKREDGSNADL